MRRTGWTDTILIVALGLAVLVCILSFVLVGNSSLALIVLLILTPMTALLLGVIGLRIYANKLDIRDDRLHTLNLWFSIGLIMFSLAEIAGALLRLTQNIQQISLTILLVQIPGILLWGFGIIQYLSSVNTAFKFSNSGRLWIGLVVVSGLASIALIAVMTTQFPDSYLIVRIIISPIVVGLCLFTIISAGLVWMFRGGLLSRPFFFTLFAFCLLTIRAAFWMIEEFALGTILDGLISIEVYIFCGASLLLSKNLEGLKTKAS